MTRGVIAVAILLVSVSGCAAEPAAVEPSIAAERVPAVLPKPVALPYPGAPWRNAAGEVSTSQITLTSLECFDSAVTVLTMGWPIGRLLRVEADGRQYIRDPANAYRDRTLAPFDGNAALPPDAKPTGLRNGDVELFISPSTSDTQVYVRRGAVVEQWPRVFPFIGCA